MISSRSRPTWIEVDLGAIERNIEALRSQAAPARVAAVLKADAYGHGAVEVARRIESRVDGICVATLEEGAQLREAGITAPILAFGGLDAELAGESARLGITPTIAGEAALAAFRRAGGTEIEIECDTGMHRLGLSAAEAAWLAATSLASGVAISGVYSHLSRAADGEEGRLATQEQIERFSACRDRLLAIPDGRVGKARFHLSASAGALFYPEARFDQVRPGISIYGYSPGEGELPLALQPALSLHSRVVQVLPVGAGEGVSYGHRLRNPDAGMVATFPAGYADGVPRSLFEGGGEVLIGGERRPLAGVVTMDYSMAWVGSDPVAPGDEVVLIGSQGEESIDAAEWALKTGTISYEVLARLGPRIPRRYAG